MRRSIIPAVAAVAAMAVSSFTDIPGYAPAGGRGKIRYNHHDKRRQHMKAWARRKRARQIAKASRKVNGRAR